MLATKTVGEANGQGYIARNVRVITMALNPIIDDDLQRLYAEYLSVPDKADTGRIIPHLTFGEYVSEIVEAFVASHRLKAIKPTLRSNQFKTYPPEIKKQLSESKIRIGGL